MLVGVPGLPVFLTVLLVGAALSLFAVSSGAVLGARDTMSVAAARSAGVPDTDLSVLHDVGGRVGVPWQLLAALARAQRDGPADATFVGPFRISSGTAGVTAQRAGSLRESAEFIAVTLRRVLAKIGVAATADMLTVSATQGSGGGFDQADTLSGAKGPRETAVVGALTALPVRNANRAFMTGVYRAAGQWALGRGTETCPATTGTDRQQHSDLGVPYPLPATHGFTGAEETIDSRGRVPSGNGNGTVTWSRFAALGRPYRDFYVTMRWRYAAWNWDGTSTDIDQDQFDWFAAKPRLVLVTNPRTGASIIAAALEAGPAPWVGISATGSTGGGAARRWRDPTRGTPAGYTGIVSGFPPAALAALGDTTGPARTGYTGQTGDDLSYQWAPDQSATPGPVGGPATTAGATARCPGRDRTGDTPGRVIANGTRVVIPAGGTVDPAAAGRTVTAPTPQVARGLKAGLGTVGLPYVWGGGTDGGGPDNGCARGRGEKNSCGASIGLDCSGLMGWTLASAGYRIPTDSTSQRADGSEVPRADGLPGDIIGYPGHVAVYLGKIDGVDYLLEAPDVGLQIRVRPVPWGGADQNLHRYWTR